MCVPLQVDAKMFESASHLRASILVVDNVFGTYDSTKRTNPRARLALELNTSSFNFATGHLREGRSVNAVNEVKSRASTGSLPRPSQGFNAARTKFPRRERRNPSINSANLAPRLFKRRVASRRDDSNFLKEFPRRF